MLSSEVEALAVRCPNWVGDIVMATPAYECLRRGFPNAHITALIRPYARGIIEPSPWFDRIVDCDDKSLAGMRHIRAALTEPKPGAGILFTNTTHSWLTFKLAGVKRTYGYRRNLHRRALTDGPWPPMQNGKVRPEPMQDYYLNLCRHLGLKPPAEPKPVLYIDEASEQAAEARLRDCGITPDDRVIGLNPGASFGSSKCWPPEYYARLAELLQEAMDCRLLLFVGPGEEDIARRIVEQSGADIINIGERIPTLAELKPLIRRCNLLVTNDTGPRQFAVAFDVPLVVLAGPIDPEYTARNLDLSTVLHLDLPCSPCNRKICPLGHHDCMRKITPETVLAAVKEAL